MTDFIISSILLGIGLAMDAFSVSLANGLNCIGINPKKTALVGGVFAGFQTLMPLIGWVCVHNLVTYFEMFQKFIPITAFTLLAIIGGKMIYEVLTKKEDECIACSNINFITLTVQGIATSIDALSVGFTIANYNLYMAISSALIIGVVTFVICYAGVLIGKKFGMVLANKAQIAGGIILIAIGIKMLVCGV